MRCIFWLGPQEGTTQLCISLYLPDGHLTKGKLKATGFTDFSSWVSEQLDWTQLNLNQVADSGHPCLDYFRLHFSDKPG